MQKVTISSKCRDVITELLIDERGRPEQSQLLLDATGQSAIGKLLREHQYADQLRVLGLPVNNKVLLSGASGCGKTSTARMIANRLGKTLLVVDLSTIISARIGDSARNIREVFAKAGKDQAVLLLDEFDLVGKARNEDTKDVGEMRRLVNSIIQQFDYLPETALLVCATNYPELVDRALMRRFQLHVRYTLPDNTLLDQYYENLLSGFARYRDGFQPVYNISFAEAKDYTLDCIKTKVVHKLAAGTL